MRTLLRSSLPIAATFFLSIGIVSAQKDPPPPPRPGAPTTETPRAYRVKDLLGTKVSLKGDLAIGTVDDVVISDAGAVEYLIVANDGKLVTVPWAAAKFDFEKRTATLSITEDQYKVIPTYTVREYPTFFEPAYRGRVYGWYGLNPRPWLPFR